MRYLITFFRLFVWFSARHLKQNRGRALTVLLGIAMGAAVFTSVRLSIHATLDSFSRSVQLLGGRSDAVVARPGGRVPESLIGPLLSHPLVEHASPVMSAYIRPADSRHEPFFLIGFDPILDRPFRSWNSSAGSDDGQVWLDLITQPFSIILSEPLAEALHVKPGQSILLECAHQSADFSILAVMASEGLALAEGGLLAVTDIATFQEFTGSVGQVDRIDLIVRPIAEDMADAELRGRFAPLLANGVDFFAPSDTRNSGRGMIRAYQLNLSILSFASLFVGMFLVYSLVALNAASRRRELAILRSIGASPRLIFFLFVAEGGLFGLAGWITAVPISSLLVKYLLGGISQTISTLFVRVQVDHLVLSAWELMLSFAVTIVVALLAALQPAREAMLVNPKEALSMSAAADRSLSFPARLAMVGLALIAVVLPLSGLPGWQGVPLPGYLAVFLLFVGFSLLSPFALQQTGTFTAPVLRRLAGMPAYLAGRYVRDTRTRTAVSVGALITAVALFASLVIMVHSFRRTVEIWVEQTVSGDLFVAPRLAEINRFRDLFTPEEEAALQSLDGVDLVPNRRLFLTFRGFPYQLEAMDFEAFSTYGQFIWLTAPPVDAGDTLNRGEGVLVSEVFANQTGITAGDRFVARVGGVGIDLPVIGVVRDYRTRGGVVFVSLDRIPLVPGKSRWSGVRLFFRETPPDRGQRLSELRGQVIRNVGDRVNMVNGADLRGAVLKIFDETFAVTTVLLLIALAVAALGITTTLTVLVLERARQLNTIFAVGGSFHQIRSMIFWEAVIMVAVGEVIGLVCGFILSYLLVFVINRQSFGWTFLYQVDWMALVFSLPLIVGTALLAALPAVRMVFREPPATLMRER